MKGEPSRMKKRWLIGVLAMALAVPVMGEAQKESDTGLKQPAIEITNMSYNFGDVFHQDKYVHAFAVKNRGVGDLVIEDVKPG